MTPTLDYNGRVVVVTGAGAGLGRSYALLLASRGAKVVVNDLGGGRHGDGKSSSAADAVVAEIKATGGVAVADYNSVVEGEKIIKTALDNFGRVDIVINNAGILRDKSFARISDQDWNLIHDVHVKGSFKTTQAAWPIFRKQGYGRIIMTTSNAGLCGNFGQANYSAAKMGLVGLAKTLAIEGEKYNILCNVIAPTAASRLTEDILPPELFEQLKPELIAPVVAYLCHESCAENGSIIDTALGWAGKVELTRSPGAAFRRNPNETPSIEDVRDNWSRIVDMSKSRIINSIHAVTAELLNVSNNDSSESDESDPFNFNQKDVILYALSIGATVTNPDDLQYLYENHADFQAIPTYYVIPGLIKVMFGTIVPDALPNVDVSPTNILHGEQYLEVYDHRPVVGQLTSKARLLDVLDKKSGAVVIIEVETFHNDELIARGQMATFVVGAGNFNGPRTSTKLVGTQNPPNRNPDAVVDVQTTLNSAALHRLTGDVNPLHIDPGLAEIAGFKKPILHGLCTVGYAVRSVLQQYANNDASLFKAYKVRFSKPVYPGETIRTKMWQEGNRIHFETSSVDSGNAVIQGAYVDLKEVHKPMLRAKLVSASSLDSDVIFKQIADGIKENPSVAKGINGVFNWKITSNGKVAKEWTLDCKAGECYEGNPKSGKADTTLTVADEDMVAIALGKLNPQAAFMKGKLKVAGNIMLTQKLSAVLKTQQSKL